MEQKMVSLVNQERIKAGLQELKVDNTLVQLARMKSQDMIDKNYFGHTSPTYGSPFDMMKNAGVKYYTAGENLAGAGSVESAHASLMASPGHRANILNSRFNHFGVGIAVGGPYGNMFTQLFIGK
ncbi:CAP domain-containing protein [Capillibacterium thermochitinicola]|nr:CAP domain-containing protein [Capillibacterium thermochitinicola]